MRPFTTCRALSQALDSKECTSVELTQTYLHRLETANPKLNAVITIDRAGAEAAAIAADEVRSKGHATPLTGVPIIHKDIFCTEGLLTTCASRMLHNFVSPYDATVVRHLKAAGTVCLGKANMDEFAMGSSNENSAYGSVGNPWSQAHVPGGSSGGSAAAVGAGLAPLATGTDTGGSIRQPAAFCGVTGLKPTYGRVSRYGMIAFASSLDQGGPLAHDAEDAALMLSYMAGFDERDSTSARREDEWLLQLRDQGLGPTAPGLTIGLAREFFTALEDSSHLDAVRKTLEGLGHTCIDISLPNAEAAIPAYYVIAGAEASTNLSRYDGVRYGHRCEDPISLEDLYERSRSEGFGEEVKRRILTGTYALSVGYFDAYYLKAQKIRRLISNDFHQAFQHVDVILTPTAPGPAFKTGALNQDTIAMYQQDKFTVPVSLAGLPALSMPCGFSGGLPLGAQLIGPAFREDLILSLARDYQVETDWHLQHPEPLL